MPYPLTTTKIFADGAKIDEMKEMDKNPLIAGFTTNPTLMKKAGITDYKAFAMEVLAAFPQKPISLEVFSDEWDEMEEQARRIASWGANVFVKIPITNTRGESSYTLIERLSQSGIKTNITAILSLEQVKAILPAVIHAPAAYISV
ncbi:MAG: transaldolase, partial [Candidatus Delongbacteria bacterium]|nr:transaldolase [Candidatus Delongbacteria bacterium]